MSKYNYLFKIVIIGDHNCGKSCILLRFAENTFRDDHVTTLGVDFKLKTIKLDRDRIRLELWDTAGMERYRTIYNSYYHSAHGVMIVYDITDRRSFDNLKNYWLNEVRMHAPQNAVLMLVGNKCDMNANGDPQQQRKVEFASAEKLASEMNISLFEVSAKTGINVEEAFTELARSMRERLQLWKMDRDLYSDDAASASAQNGGDSDAENELSTGFHVDGVIGHKPYHAGQQWSCCSGSGRNGTFV